MKNLSINPKKHLISQRALSSLLVLILGCLVSETISAQGYPELSVGLGLNYLKAKNSTLQPTLIETDNLINSKTSAGGNIAIGAGYVFPLEQFTHSAWAPFIKPMINLRYFNQTVYGAVYQFQDPVFANYNYALPVNSMRLMGDLAVGIISWHEFSGYAIGGYGRAWNRLHYSDTPIPGVVSGSVLIPTNESAHSVPEVGGGVTYAASAQVNVSIEYLYTDFKKNELATEGFVNGRTAAISSSGIPLNSQSVQIIVNWKVI